MHPSLVPMNAANAWVRFAIAYSQMAMAAGEVIFRRSMRMSQGAMTGPEAVGMVLEKATAFATATERAAVAAAAGGDAARIARAALQPYPHQDPLERPQATAADRRAAAAARGMIAIRPIEAGDEPVWRLLWRDYLAFYETDAARRRSTPPPSRG